VEAWLKTGLKLWRGVAGQDTGLERVLRRQYKTVRSRIDKEVAGENYVLFWSRSPEKKRIGIYLKGSCHLQTIFACKAMIRRTLDGSCCIFGDGEIAGARSDLILQTLSDQPQEALDQILTKLKIPANYFRPQLFEQTFSVPGLRGHEEFRKAAVFFSIGSDVVRTLYRHRQTGILVDPGGWWLNQPMERVLGDLTSVGWFRENFDSIGRIAMQEFASNYEKIIGLVRERTGAQIVVFNVPTVEPRKLVHNYQFVRDPMARRTREFNVALAELSRRLDFPIVDVDRILKKAGVAGQKDFAHFPLELAPVVAKEAFGVMSDLGIFERGVLEPHRSRLLPSRLL
jgi:hypothetical protein